MIDYDIDKLVSEVDFNSNKLQSIGKILLTNREIEVLDRYNVNYKKCNSLKEVLFEIEDIIDDMDYVDEDLDLVSLSISERDYYQNTNK